MIETVTYKDHTWVIITILIFSRTKKQKKKRKKEKKVYSIEGLNAYPKSNIILAV